jgi:hypothetical protein
MRRQLARGFGILFGYLLMTIILRLITVIENGGTAAPE